MLLVSTDSFPFATEPGVFMATEATSLICYAVGKSLIPGLLGGKDFDAPGTWLFAEIAGK